MPEEQTVMDAVNAALGDSVETPEPVDAVDPPADTSPDGEGDLGDVSPDDAAGDAEGAEVSEGEADAETEKGPNGERERNPDGTWKKAEEPKVEDKKEPAKKEKDPINDPIPKDLK